MTTQSVQLEVVVIAMLLLSHTKLLAYTTHQKCNPLEVRLPNCLVSRWSPAPQHNPHQWAFRRLPRHVYNPLMLDYPEYEVYRN